MLRNYDIINICFKPLKFRVICFSSFFFFFAMPFGLWDLKSLIKD